MGDAELTHLVGGGILAILVLDRVTNLVRVALGRRNGDVGVSVAHIEALTRATVAGFAEQREDNKAIREHLQSIASTLQGLVTGVALIKDRQRERRE